MNFFLFSGVNTAIDRRVKSRKTYLTEQVQKVPDHDKKTGSTITPRAYMFLQKKLLEQNQIPDPFKSAAFEAENRDRDKDEVELVLECADEENASDEDSGLPVDVENHEGPSIYENLSSDENSSDESVSYGNDDLPRESN